MCLNDVTRATVKVERELYAQAQSLGIDIPTLWRMSLQRAVELVMISTKKKEDCPEHVYPRNEEDETTENALFGAVARLHREQGVWPGYDTRERISEGIKDAASRAWGESGGDLSDQGPIFPDQDPAFF
jgi:hypothetical protein